MKAQELNLESEVLDEFREQFSETLALVVRELKLRRLYQGSITAKLDIRLEEHHTADGEIVRTMSIKPDLSMKLGAKAKVECKEKNGMYLQLDEDGKPIIGSCQVDIDELLARDGA